MRILSRYVLGLFLTTFLLSFFVVSGVLTIGLLAPLAGHFMNGAALPYLMRLAFVGFHESLQLTVPISLFFASVLVFMRLKADGEIDALRACGIRLWRAAAGPLVFAALVSGALLFVNLELLPREHELRRRLKTELLLASGLSLVKPGDMVDAIPGMRFRFDARDGETMLGLMARDFTDPQVTRQLTAGRARLSSEGKRSILDLEDMALEPLDATQQLRLRAKRFQYRLPETFRSSVRYVRRDKDRPTRELLDYIARRRQEKMRLEGRDGLNPDDVRLLAHLSKTITSAGIEFGRRIVYGLAPFCFVLFGLALAARTRRADIIRVPVLALVTLLAYYLGTLFLASLRKSPALHPEMLIYLIPAAVLVAGLWLMRKM